MCLFWPIVVSKYVQPSYLRQCRINSDFAALCKTYRLNDIDCFPWNTTLCTTEKVEEHVMCIRYVCPVRS